MGKTNEQLWVDLSMVLFVVISAIAISVLYSYLPENARRVIGTGLGNLILLIVFIFAVLFSLYWIPYTYYPDQLNTLIEYIKGLN